MVNVVQTSFQMHLLTTEKFDIFIQIPYKCVPKHPIEDLSALVRAMAIYMQYCGHMYHMVIGSKKSLFNTEGQGKWLLFYRRYFHLQCNDRKYVFSDPINTRLTQRYAMAWHQTCNNPLLEPMINLIHFAIKHRLPTIAVLMLLSLNWQPKRRNR